MRAKTIINQAPESVSMKNLQELLDLCIKIDDSVDSVCKEANINKYNMFSGNHCIQTATALKYILDGIFNIAGYKTEILYGIMSDDECHGRIYNHAYLYMFYKGVHYIIDVSRKTRNALIVCSKDIIYKYGQGSLIEVANYDDINILKLEKLDYSKLFNEEQEFFTLEPSRKFLGRVKFLCQNKIQNFKKW